MSKRPRISGSREHSMATNRCVPLQKLSEPPPNPESPPPVGGVRLGSGVNKNFTQPQRDTSAMNPAQPPFRRSCAPFTGSCGAFWTRTPSLLTWDPFEAIAFWPTWQFLAPFLNLALAFLDLETLLPELGLMWLDLAFLHLTKARYSQTIREGVFFGVPSFVVFLKLTSYCGPPIRFPHCNLFGSRLKGLQREPFWGPLKKRRPHMRYGIVFSSLVPKKAKKRDGPYFETPAFVPWCRFPMWIMASFIGILVMAVSTLTTCVSLETHFVVGSMWRETNRRAIFGFLRRPSCSPPFSSECSEAFSDSFRSFSCSFLGLVKQTLLSAMAKTTSLVWALPTGEETGWGIGWRTPEMMGFPCDTPVR